MGQSSLDCFPDRGGGDPVVRRCITLQGKPDHVFGVWGGPHAGIDFIGGVADVQFDCASGTIDDPVYPTPDGSFSVKGTYRTGTTWARSRSGNSSKARMRSSFGPDRQGSEKNAPRLMTLRVALEDGTELGPYTLTEGMPPELTHCA